MSEVIEVNFDPQLHQEIYQMMKQIGIPRTEKFLLDNGFDPRFVRVIIKRIMKLKGW